MFDLRNSLYKHRPHGKGRLNIRWGFQTAFNSAVRASLMANHPEAMRVGRNIARLVADDLGVDITEDEETFLALHAARLLDH